MFPDTNKHLIVFIWVVFLGSFRTCSSLHVCIFADTIITNIMRVIRKKNNQTNLRFIFASCCRFDMLITSSRNISLGSRLTRCVPATFRDKQTALTLPILIRGFCTPWSPLLPSPPRSSPLVPAIPFASGDPTSDSFSARGESTTLVWPWSGRPRRGKLLDRVREAWTRTVQQSGLSASRQSTPWSSTSEMNVFHSGRVLASTVKAAKWKPWSAPI